MAEGEERRQRRRAPCPRAAATSMVSGCPGASVTTWYARLRHLHLGRRRDDEQRREEVLEVVSADVGDRVDLRARRAVVVAVDRDRHLAVRTRVVPQVLEGEVRQRDDVVSDLRCATPDRRGCRGRTRRAGRRSSRRRRRGSCRPRRSTGRAVGVRPPERSEDAALGRVRRREASRCRVELRTAPALVVGPAAGLPPVGFASIAARVLHARMRYPGSPAMTPPPKPNAGELGGTICGSSSCCQYCEMLMRTWNFRTMSLIRVLACVCWASQNAACPRCSGPRRASSSRGRTGTTGSRGRCPSRAPNPRTHRRRRRCRASRAVSPYSIS